MDKKITICQQNLNCIKTQFSQTLDTNENKNIPRLISKQILVTNEGNRRRIGFTKWLKTQ